MNTRTRKKQSSSDDCFFFVPGYEAGEALGISQRSRFRSTSGCFRSKTALLKERRTADNMIFVKAPYTSSLAVLI